MKKIHYLSFATVFFALGCASNQNETAVTVIAPAAINWKIDGKIGVSYPENECNSKSDCRKKSDQGSIKWQQKGDNFDVTLSDPFGREVMNLDGNAQQITVVYPNQKTFKTTSDKFVTLFTSESNSAALSSLKQSWLKYWVTGRPAPDESFTKKEGSRFIQAGYAVNTTNWKQTPVGDMPSVVTVKKDNFKLRLVVKQWSE